MTNSPWKETLHTADKVLANTYKRPEILFVSGEGAHLQDAEGKDYIDMTSGIAVTNLGHASKVVRDALREGIDGLIHTSNLYHTEPAIRLASALVDASFADRVFFANSGTEAVEGAFKFARLYHQGKRHVFLSFAGSFHGRTMAALAATDRPDYQKPFEPLPGGYRQAPWNDARALSAIDEEVAAVIVEPIQGEMGVRVADPQWLRSLRTRCDETGTLLIFDEIQCGLGRTGRLWAHEDSGVTPDIMTLAKPLAGGLPMAAVLMTEAVAAFIQPGHHGTTFGGGPLVAHVAHKVFSTLSKDSFLQTVRERGSELTTMLRNIVSPVLDEVRGEGLMIGVKVTVPPAQVVQKALEEGLLVVPSADGVVRFLPPLSVDNGTISEAVNRFAKALKACEA